MPKPDGTKVTFVIIHNQQCENHTGDPAHQGQQNVQQCKKGFPA